MKLRRLALLPAFSVLSLTAAAAACSADENSPGGNGCLPIDLHVEPPTPVSRGQTITIVSPGYQCKPHSIHGDETISYRAHPLAVVAVAPDGSFRAEVRIPGDAAGDKALLAATGPTHYKCPRNASCASYQVVITIKA
jgi:hypothetical protein